MSINKNASHVNSVPEKKNYNGREKKKKKNEVLRNNENIVLRAVRPVSFQNPKPTEKV